MLSAFLGEVRVVIAFATGHSSTESEVHEFPLRDVSQAYVTAVSLQKIFVKMPGAISDLPSLFASIYRWIKVSQG